MKSTIIIAEAGVNHNGDINLAKKLIDVAKESGADFVKFQTFITEKAISKNAKRAEYQKINTIDDDDSQVAMVKKLELSNDDHILLINHCTKKNISFLSTPFDHESIELLIKLNTQIFKIPSGEITNKPYLEHIGSLGKRVILSTGMSTLAEIEAALDILIKKGTLKKTLLFYMQIQNIPLQWRM